MKAERRYNEMNEGRINERKVEWKKEMMNEWKERLGVKKWMKNLQIRYNENVRIFFFQGSHLFAGYLKSNIFIL